MDNYLRQPGIIYDQKLFRRDVRRDVRNCVLFILLFYVVNMLSSSIVMVVAMFRNPNFVSSIMNDSGLGMFGGSGQNNLDSAMGSALESVTEGSMIGLMSIVGIVCGGCVFLILRKKRFFTDVALPSAETLTLKKFLVLVVITQGIQGAYSLIVALIDYLLPSGISLAENYGDTMENLFTPVGLLYVVLIGPVFEELIFRGAIMGTLRRFGNNFAILFSSILFGFYHMLILQIPFAFVMGLLFGYVATRWSLRTAIVLHIIVNGLSCLFSMHGNEVLVGLAGLAMIGCAILIVVFAIVWKDALKSRIQEGAAYYANTYAHGFSSIAFWIYIVITTAIGIAILNGINVPL